MAISLKKATYIEHPKLPSTANESKHSFIAFYNDIPIDTADMF